MGRLKIVVVGLSVLVAAVVSVAPGTAMSESPVVLLDEGKAPREPLRWTTPAVGTTRFTHFSDTFTTRTDELFGGESAGEYQAIGQSTVVESGPDHRSATVRGEIIDASAEDASADVAVKALVGYTVDSDITTDGRVVDTRGNPVEFADPTVWATADELLFQIQGIGGPFPAKPVGPGARWRITEKLRVGGAQIVQQREVGLVRRDGNVVELAVRLEQTAKPGPIDIPGLAEDAHLTIRTWRGVGRGTQVLDLAKPYHPLRAQLHLVVRQRLRAREPGKSKTYTIPYSRDLTIKTTSQAPLPVVPEDFFVALPEGYVYTSTLESGALVATSLQAGRVVQGPAGQSALVGIATCVDPNAVACVARSSPLTPNTIEDRTVYRYQLGDNTGLAWKPNEFELIVLGKDPAFVQDVLTTFIRAFT